MCGRYFFELAEGMAFYKLKKKIDQLALFEYAREEVFPSNQALVLVSDEHDDYTLDVMKWGITGYKGNLLINARSEGIEDKRTFQPMLDKRCLIPCNGFYEWMKTGKQKQKIYIRKKDEPLVYMAGIYNKDKEFVIVTGESQQEMKEVHGRTPIMISEEQISSYFADDISFEVDNASLTFTKAEPKHKTKQLGLFSFEEEQS